MTDYTRPTFSNLLQRIKADLNALPSVLVGVLAPMWAKVCNDQHAHLDYIKQQQTPINCNLEALNDWALCYNTPQLGATSASGALTAIGANGSQILKDTVLKANNGLTYVVTTAVSIANGQAIVNVKCNTVGNAGNLPAGAVLTLNDPILGVNSTLTVANAGVTGGADAETLESWRSRVIAEWQQQVAYGARAGKPADYVFWAQSAHPSVSGALVYSCVGGAGTVNVYPICNGLTNRLPTTAIITAVNNYYKTVAPAGAKFSVLTPSTLMLNVQIKLNAAVDNSTNRAAIISSLNALCLSKNAENETILLADIDNAIALVTTNYTRTLPAANITAVMGQLFVLGGVTWA